MHVITGGLPRGLQGGFDTTRQTFVKMGDGFERMTDRLSSRSRRIRPPSYTTTTARASYKMSVLGLMASVALLAKALLLTNQTLLSKLPLKQYTRSFSYFPSQPTKWSSKSDVSSGTGPIPRAQVIQVFRGQWTMWTGRVPCRRSATGIPGSRPSSKVELPTVQ